MNNKYSVKTPLGGYIFGPDAQAVINAHQCGRSNITINGKRVEIRSVEKTADGRQTLIVEVEK